VTKSLTLRSDTVTKHHRPCARLWPTAEVGDDVLPGRPDRHRLQARAAETFGKEAGLFVSFRQHGQSYLHYGADDARSRSYLRSGRPYLQLRMASMSSLARRFTRVFHRRRHYELGTDCVGDSGKSYSGPQTSLVALENTHNMRAHGLSDASRHEICDKAHEAGFRFILTARACSMLLFTSARTWRR